ncbi:glycosyltransferase family 4 protein [Acidianus sp. RZ1]|uniref:glycosyltransferase family 4 protein n=1 Tax=Acidianus sp. RZ1 TaxID=1540082 RepID=UPI001490CCBE|nr:glycosyltransferase family 4 protein [Acidianus sp. RZ1]NON61715.1 glycosyltransferase family 4 protein [Acidianus sp. RZ1]
MEKGKEMKIVHVVHSIYPVIGGIEKAVFEIAYRQSKKHEVTIVTSSKVDKKVPDIFTEKIKSIRILGMPDLTLPLGKAKAIAEADIVHYHSQNSLFAIKLLNKNKNNIFTVMALNSLKTHPNPIIRKLSPFYSRYTLGKVLKYSKTIIAKNQGDVSELRKLGREAYLVPDGLEEIYFKKKIEHQFRDKLGYDYVIYVGRLHRMKGIDVLLKAAKLIKSNILFIGPGNIYEYKEMAMKLGVEKKCNFMGTVDEMTKIDAIDSAQLLIVPSISDYAEAFSIVLSEAWSRKKAVVASSVGSLKYRVKHMVNGLLVPPNDPIKLAEAVNFMIDNPEISREMGEKGNDDGVSWDFVANTLESIYEGIKN